MSDLDFFFLSHYEVTNTDKRQQQGSSNQENKSVFKS